MATPKTNNELNDMLETIAEKISENETIKEHCDGRIKLYEAPETMEKDGKPFIIIDPLTTPLPTSFASDTELAYEFTYQIDVQSSNRKLTKLIQNEVYQQMKQIDFFILPGGLDEYFEETKRFVDARRYRGRSSMYQTNY